MVNIIKTLETGAKGVGAAVVGATAGVSSYVSAHWMINTGKGLVNPPIIKAKKPGIFGKKIKMRQNVLTGTWHEYSGDKPVNCSGMLKLKKSKANKAAK